jgi:hypothetical protein
MKFTLSTKPLQNAIDLGIIKENISKFNQKSCLAQVTATRENLRINIEAPSIYTEIVLKGSGDSDTSETIFVDCALLRQLIDSFDKDITSIDFIEGGIVLHSGSSKFTLPKLLDANNLSLNRPTTTAEGNSIELKSGDWKFVKEHQMFAISIWMIHPVYTKVWIGQDGKVIIGDIDNVIFTLSNKSNLGSTCLLNPTIINLFTNLPEGSKIKKVDNSYVLTVDTDGYVLTSQFIPEYEDDEGVGNYNSDTILETLKTPESYIEVDVAPINKFLNQADIVATAQDTSTFFKVEGNTLTLNRGSGDFKVDITKTGELENYSGDFKSSFFKSIFSSVDGDKIKIGPVYNEGELSGSVFWTDNLSIVLAFQE